MSGILRVIFDTSTLVSAALRTGSVPDQALTKAMRYCDMCARTETLAEMAQVLSRDKFNRYRARQSPLSFVALINRTARLFVVQDADLADVDPPCRDLRDN